MFTDYLNITTTNFFESYVITHFTNICKLVFEPGMKKIKQGGATSHIPPHIELVVSICYQNYTNNLQIFAN